MMMQEVMMHRELCLVAVGLLVVGALPAQVDTVLSTGGPDGFGYRFIDSTELGGPTYAWQGITGSGTALNLDNNGEADTDTTVNQYYFYGNWYNIFRVGNNGGVLVGPTTLSTDDISANNQELPQVTHPIPVIFPFWDDFDDDTGNVYWAELATCPHPHSSDPCMIFEWYSRPHSFNVGAATLEAILFADGDIIFQYADTNFGNAAYNFGASATVGIEDDAQDPSYYLQYSFMTADIPSSLAILFESPMIFNDDFESGNTTAWSTVVN
jgi:hypothetical protein